MRRSTRVSWRVRVRLSSLDSNQTFAENCETLVVNMHGCALQAPRRLSLATPIQLEIAGRTLTGRIVDAVPLNIDDSRWMLGIALEQAGNHWGIQYPPEDWLAASAAQQTPDASPRPAPGPLIGDATTVEAPRKAPQPVAAADAAGPLGATLSVAEERPPQSIAPRGSVTPKLPVPTVQNSAPPVQIATLQPPVAAAPAVSEAVLQEIRAQLLQLQQAQAKQEAILFQDRAERQAARQASEKAIAEQCERVRQAKDYVESLVCSFPAVVEAQVQEHAQTILRRLQPQTARPDMERVVSEARQAVESALDERATRLLNDLRAKVEQTFAQRQQAFDASHEAAASRLQELEKRAEHITSLVDLELQEHAEEAIREARQAVDSALDERAVQLLSELRGELEQAFSQRQQAFDEARAAATSQLQDLEKRAEHIISLVDLELQKHADEIVRDARQAMEAPSEEGATRLFNELREQLEQNFQQRQQASDAAHAAAATQLEELQRRAEHITSLVDLELQKRAEEVLGEATTEIKKVTKEVQQACADFSHGQAAAQTQGAQYDDLKALLEQAGNASAELRATLKAVQQEHRLNEAATARLQHRCEAVQTWLAKETEKFEESVRQAFVEAGGEIRGRIAQAVETVVQPIDTHSDEIQLEMGVLAQRHIEQLHQHVDIACARLESCSEQARAAIAADMQARVAEALDSFTQDAQRLARHSMERWQSAFTQTLAAIPRLLAENLTAEAAPASPSAANEPAPEQ